MKALIISNHTYPGRALIQLISILTNCEVEIDLYVDSSKNGCICPPGTTIYNVNNNSSSYKNIYFKVFPLWNFWESVIKRKSIKKDWDFIFVRESLLANTALKIGHELNIPVFLDLRENRPDMILANSFGLKRIMAFPYVKLVEIHEAIYFRQLAHIFTVSNELKQWVIKKYGIDAQYVTTLPNYPDSFNLQSAKKFKKQSYNNSGVLQIVFAGNVSFSRGLQDVLPAIKLLKATNKKVRLDIIGSGHFMNNLKTMASDLGISNEVNFLDLVPPEMLMETLSLYDVGLASYCINSHTNVTVPGKLFEYMAVGLPILSSARKSVIRLLDESKSGIVFYDRSPEEIASKIELLMDASLRESLGQKGIHAIENLYNSGVNIRLMNEFLNSYFG